MDLQDGDLKCTVDAPVPEVGEGKQETSDGLFLNGKAVSVFVVVVVIFNCFNLWGRWDVFVVVQFFQLMKIYRFDMRLSCRSRLQE